MGTYSYAQLMSLWINAGGPKALAPLAAAIAEAESGGNSDAYNGHDSNGRGGTQVSAGLWQISNGTMTPVPGWSNPATNAQDAVAKWKGASGFSPWGTYTSGAYKAFMNGSTTPDPNVPGSPTQLMAAAAAAQSADCLWSIGWGGVSGTAGVSSAWDWINAAIGAATGQGLGSVAGSAGAATNASNVGAFKACVISKSQARALLAIANMAAGASFLLVGFALTVVMAGPGRRIIQLVMPVIGKAAPKAAGAQSAAGSAQARRAYGSGLKEGRAQAGPSAQEQSDSEAA